MNKEIFRKLLIGVDGILTGMIIENIIHPISTITIYSAILTFIVLSVVIYYQEKSV